MEQNPVIGLPKAVAVALDALLAENKLTSWNISGGNKNVTLKLGFSKSHDHDDDCQPFQQTFRSKPPSAVARDRSRMNKWIREKDSQGESGFSSSINSDQYMYQRTDSVCHVSQPLLHASPDSVVHQSMTNDEHSIQHVEESSCSSSATNDKVQFDSPSLNESKGVPMASTPVNQIEHSDINEDDCNICSKHEQHNAIYKLMKEKPQVLAQCTVCKGVLADSHKDCWEKDFVRPVYKCTTCTNPILHILIMNEMTPPYIKTTFEAFYGILHGQNGYKRNRSNENIEILRHAFLHIALKILKKHSFYINPK